MTFISTPSDRVPNPPVTGLRIGVLQTGRAPEPLRNDHGDYGQMCRDLVGATSATSQIYAVFDGEFPSTSAECDAWIVTGSRSGVHDGSAWIAGLRSFLQQAYAAHRKIVGLCFGHQIVAEALGGAVRRHPGGPGIGVMEYQLAGTGGETERAALAAWHYDQVYRLPPGARVVARSNFCPYAGLAYGDQAISFQAHPEFSIAYLSDLLDHYKDRGLAPDQVREASRSLSTPTHSALIADRLRAFLTG